MNESLLGVQIIEKNGRSYALLLPPGSPYEDLFQVLEEFIGENKSIHKAKLEAEEARKQKAEAEANPA